MDNNKLSFLLDRLAAYLTAVEMYREFWNSCLNFEREI